MTAIEEGYWTKLYGQWRVAVFGWWPVGTVLQVRVRRKDGYRHVRSVEVVSHFQCDDGLDWTVGKPRR